MIVALSMNPFDLMLINRFIIFKLKGFNLLKFIYDIKEVALSKYCFNLKVVNFHKETFPIHVRIH
jgi:hypothetical protein